MFAGAEVNEDGLPNTPDRALNAGEREVVDFATRLVDGTLVVVGSAPVVFDDYGVEKPTAAIVVSLEDEGTIEFQLFFAKA